MPNVLCIKRLQVDYSGIRKILYHDKKKDDIPISASREIIFILYSDAPSIPIKIALKLFKFDCVIFHDVDLAPINYYNSYQCDQLTKHMMIHLSVAINTNKFKLPYETYIGGVIKISTHHFITVNGYSNDYWGLDNENDDNFEKRLKFTGIKYIHVNDKIGQYIYIPYTSSYSLQSNHLKKLLENSDEQINFHGLDAVSYKVISRSNQPFFTHLRVLIKQS
ncbi:unnamed protein product [Schistosoma rodhaini]|uniref:Galactosyltransferase N-terminal domain-containing protein n=1 Tax=Schistosoma rodhaini TaxID=6188 RepID=A0AA85G3T9_9TREM|nr:unnamed protein product [Schistosoma rodhaini]